MKIKELFTDSTKWIKKASAKNAKGEYVLSTDSEACCWCLSGAAFRCYSGAGAYNKVMDLIDAEVNGAVAWNDATERTFEEVKALVEKLDI